MTTHEFYLIRSGFLPKSLCFFKDSLRAFGPFRILLEHSVDGAIVEPSKKRVKRRQNRVFEDAGVSCHKLGVALVVKRRRCREFILNLLVERVDRGQKVAVSVVATHSQVHFVVGQKHVLVLDGESVYRRPVDEGGKLVDLFPNWLSVLLAKLTRRSIKNS